MNLTGTLNYEYTLTDHLGNNRVNFDSSGGAVAKQQQDYYPFGLEIARGTTPSPKNEYLYNKKELQEELTQYDYGARFYDPVIARFNTVDRFAEKYNSFTSYQYALDNPVLNVDMNGDSVRVGEAGRAEMNKILQATYGDNATKFNYDKNGNLSYSGDTQGFDSKQRTLFAGLSRTMSEATITNVVFGESTRITLNDGTTQNMVASQHGGAVTALVGEANVSQNTILINPNSTETTKEIANVYAVTNAYYLQPIDPANGPRFEVKTILNNLASAFAHELGHVLFKGNTQDKVIDYENNAREHTGLPRRPYDEHHNRTQR